MSRPFGYDNDERVTLGSRFLKRFQGVPEHEPGTIPMSTTAFDEWYARTTGEPAYYVYVMYDTAGHCLYVGITNNLRNRMRAHYVEKDWVAKEVVDEGSIHLYEGPSEAWARALEKELIQRLGPVYNDQHNAHGKNVRSYITAKYEAAGCAGVMATIEAMGAEDTLS